MCVGADVGGDASVSFKQLEAGKSGCRRDQSCLPPEMETAFLLFLLRPHQQQPPHSSSLNHRALQRRTDDMKGTGSCRHIGMCVRSCSCEIEPLQICCSSFILSVAAEYLKSLYHHTIRQNNCVGCHFILSAVCYALFLKAFASNIFFSNQ